MQIEVIGFEENRGVQFRITARTETERALVTACVNPDKKVLVFENRNDEAPSEFVLTLPVSN